MIEGKSRSELFDEVLVQLESAAEGAAGPGAKEEATHIREILIPFVQKEKIFAEMMEEE